ncbi:MAG: hypothetical protein A3J66_00145 [Candidatus Magasanikbacteria bacterium RIFCSPHIGHO2_02_FULL_47_14]|uniref:Nucleotide pyrophosphohydrolase n=1 Tax=Candidatus Magasanikbacteria bacterium RIFCSPHIGHO2_02_FULL_47_14 TaxID=1798680 RepID=A0A1F6LZL5_9BACT|nr:MAG: hypothetical protein A3J66_00145 [Candidatus Magasanikbacteria bacterium RIFCSPHIGHO2_02_FULL_47_14]
MPDLQTLIADVIAFRDTRGWTGKNKPKDLAISLILEAGEVLEHFQWKSDEDIKQYVVDHKEEISDELADVFIYLLTLSRDLGVDLIEASYRKMEKNAIKYPAPSDGTL